MTVRQTANYSYWVASQGCVEQYAPDLRNVTYTGHLLYALYLEARFWVGYAHCHLAGHAWVDESWAGPDTGGMGCRCDRCGFSWSHTLY